MGLFQRRSVGTLHFSLAYIDASIDYDTAPCGQLDAVQCNVLNPKISEAGMTNNVLIVDSKASCIVFVCCENNPGGNVFEPFGMMSAVAHDRVADPEVFLEGGDSGVRGFLLLR